MTQMIDARIIIAQEKHSFFEMDLVQMSGHQLRVLYNIQEMPFTHDNLEVSLLKSFDYRAMLARSLHYRFEVTPLHDN